MQYVLAPAVIAAIIAAAVAIVSAIVAFLAARWQLRAALRKVDVDILSLKQAQLKDIMTKRLEVYPRLWSIVQSRTSDWRIERKTVDEKWAREFLQDLNTCHANCGVFFSETVYRSYFAFREKLIQVVSKTTRVSDSDLEWLDEAWSTEGLATHLKQDLGSYEGTVFDWPVETKRLLGIRQISVA